MNQLRRAVVRSSHPGRSRDALLTQPGEMGVILLREPSDVQIERFLESQCSLPFSYPEVGASRVGAPPGQPLNHLRRRLGVGRETFTRAVEALRRWKMYESGWTKLCWPRLLSTKVLL